MQFSKTSPLKSGESSENSVEKIASNPVTSVAVMVFSALIPVAGPSVGSPYSPTVSLTGALFNCRIAGHTHSLGFDCMSLRGPLKRQVLAGPRMCLS